MIRHQHNELVFYSYQIFSPFPQMMSITSTRLGGVSEVPYATLNLSLNGDDAQEAVVCNRARLYKALHLDQQTISLAQLVHGTHIEIIQQATECHQVLTETDGLVTNIPHQALMLLVGDCAAVSFLDPQHNVVALAHAGWRGTAGHILQKMVSIMQDTFHSEPANILVSISPSIGPCCFQVREDVQKSFSTEAQRFFTPQDDGRFLLDIWAAQRFQLIDSGVRPEHIEVAEVCTACHTDEFYSHRREKGKTGRFAGIVALRLSPFRYAFTIQQCAVRQR